MLPLLIKYLQECAVWQGFMPTYLPTLIWRN